MKLDRRFFLRGTFRGAMAMVSLPFLDCFLDGNGEALAATGQPLPMRFGTYFYGLGLTEQLWVPKIGGKDWEMTPQLKPLEQLRSKINVWSGLRFPLDDKPNYQHWTGAVVSLTGMPCVKDATYDSRTIDQQVADTISRGARFKSVAAAASGDPKHSVSSLGGRNTLPAEPTPLSLYKRLFGPGFQDPSKPDWKPDAKAMVQQSVLSVVAEDRKRAMQNLSAADRARMDQYFTSVREAELQMEAQLRRPEIRAQVAIPSAPPEDLVGTNALSTLRETTPLMAKLGAIAMATDQTRVFNFAVSTLASGIFVPGDPLGYHQTSHEEPIDAALGYQPRVAQYNLNNMELFYAFLKELDSVPEGDGTLLDNSLIFAVTDSAFAKLHSIEGMPIFTAGGARGRMKTGYHIKGDGQSTVTRVGLTLQRALGIPIESWGKGSLATSNPYSELLA